MFVPQRTHIPSIDLAWQISYPSHPRPELLAPDGQVSDALRLALSFVHLEHLLTRSTLIPDDPLQTLSGGEMQLLAFARVFYQRPPLVILDESTSALSPWLEAEMYAKLCQLRIPFHSVCHRPELAKWHTHMLTVTGNEAGSWKLEVINPPPLT
jgi:ATP-binding cassette subfamily D (ALD) long-chain fatty acid import protein